MASNLTLTGSCFCHNLTYQVHLPNSDSARTSLCHCHSCKKAFGGAFGLTTKVPIESFSYDDNSGKATVHAGDNGSGAIVYREFCGKCGSYICEYGEHAKDKFRYIAYGSFDDPGKVPPKGEFFCVYREKWMPEIPDVFHKDRIKE